MGSSISHPGVIHSVPESHPGRVNAIVIQPQPSPPGKFQKRTIVIIAAVMVLTVLFMIIGVWGSTSRGHYRH